MLIVLNFILSDYLLHISMVMAHLNPISAIMAVFLYKLPLILIIIWTVDWWFGWLFLLRHWSNWDIQRLQEIIVTKFIKERHFLFVKQEDNTHAG